MFITVHTFNDSGYTYSLLVDFQNELIDVRRMSFVLQGNLTSQTVYAGLDLSSSIIGKQYTQAYMSRCVGPTKVTARCQYTFPYVYITKESNSIDCGYQAPTCNITFDVNVINATNGTNNGAFSINNISPAGSYQFSLDNSIWQSASIFTQLFAGNYQLYVKSATCMVSRYVTVLNDVTENYLLPERIPWENTKELCYFFRLIIDGVTHEIREPIKWDSVTIIGERDKEFHGYEVKYSDGNIDLGFDCDSGMSLIKDVYDTKGNDGDVFFRYGYSYMGQDYILFPGKLMLNTYKWYADRVECSIESEDFDSTITSRADVKVSMTATKTFDNITIAPPMHAMVKLHPKEILTRYKCENAKPILYDANLWEPDQFAVYIMPDTSMATLQEIDSSFSYPGSITNTVPYEDNKYLLLFKNDGWVDINIKWDFSVELVHSHPFENVIKNSVVYLTKRKKINGGFQIVREEISAKYTGTQPTPTINMVVNYQKRMYFETNESLYIYFEIEFKRKESANLKVTQKTLDLDIQMAERSKESYSKGYFIQDVLQQCLSVVSNNRYLLRSSFYKLRNPTQLTDGDGSKYVNANGYMIRNFEDRPLTLSLKTVLDSLKAIHCIGYLFSKDNVGMYMRVERASYFYKDVQILVIANPESYREEVDINNLYNEIEIGYNKFLDTGYNTLDEFNTKHIWLTPLRKVKKKLSLLSEMIASGYAIEKQRRAQFSETPSSTGTYDEDPFIISVQDINGWQSEKNEPFDNVTGVFSPETSYNLRISPKRMLYNWFIGVKDMFHYKERTERLKNTVALQNKSLVTDLKSSEKGIGDIANTAIGEVDDVLLSDMESTGSIYKPDKVFLACRLNVNQVQLINLAMTERHTPEKNLGYITVQKPDLSYQAIWVDSIRYNFATEKAEIEGRKKNITNQTPVLDYGRNPPPEDCCKYLVVNGCWLLINSKKTTL